ncbi:histidine kinase [uncultured Ferrimonas sp.]|uniref:histidine kinase n=1 Tax=uncultured Ferrimonas sp. TaxID=432640 RepID=UPI0026291DA9|nr:histidine kinase [uncultured Ferrimonas sp.]
MSRKLSLGRSVALTMITVLICVSLQASVGLIAAVYSIGDGRAINYAGSLRMRSYQLLFIANSGSTELPHKLDQFELVLHALEGNLATQRLLPQSLQHRFHQVESRWDVMRQRIESGRIRSYVEELRPFVDEIDGFVRALEEYARKKLVLLLASQLAAIVLILLLSAMAFRYVRRQILLPLQQLEKNAEKMAAGDFNFSSPTSKFRELSTFGHTMTSAGRQLNSLYQRLADRVEAQDLALKQAHLNLTFLYDAAFELHALPVHVDTIGTSLQALRLHTGANMVLLEIDDNSEQRWQFGPSLEPSQRIVLPPQHGISGRLLISHTTTVDKELLHSFALLMSQTLRSQQDAEQRAQMGLMEERAVIARELHDSLGQLLAYMKIQLSLLKRATKGGQQEAISDATEALQESIDMAYKQLRELLSTFRLQLVAADLQQALESMVQQLQPRTEAQLQLDYQLPKITLEANRQVHLLQLLQEAVVNAIKHAGASNIAIRGYSQQGEHLLQVEDNGSGMAVDKDLTGHFGLGIMRERARSMGAQLSISNSERGGVCVTVRLRETQEKTYG